MATLSLDPQTHTVHLPAPRLKGVAGRTATASHGCREFLPRPLTVQQVSALLWSASGVNRPGSWGRGAPSARSWQEITMYAVLADAAYRYEASRHRLQRVAAGDLRALTADEPAAGAAPLTLVYVEDFGPADQAHEEEHGLPMGGDVGCLVENVCRYCNVAGLSTGVHGLTERKQLAVALGLAATQRIALLQSVGYPKPVSH